MTTATNGSVDTVTVNTGALSKAMHDLAKRDVVCFRSSQEIRNQLVTDLLAAGYTTQSFAEKDSAFYREMMALSGEALANKSSDKGLTQAEKDSLPNGVYDIAAMIADDIKPSALPPFATEANRIGKLSIRRYLQQQKGQWFASVRNSVEKAEAAIQLVSGGAQARTKSIAERQLTDIAKIVNRDRNSETPALLVNELNYLVKVAARLADDNELSDPLEKDTDSE